MTSRTFSSGRMRLSAISVLAVSILVLSGCSNGERPKNGSSDGAAPSATSASSATQSATATPTPKPVYKPADAKGKAQNVPVPVKPALADKNTKEGLEAFAKYWYALLNFAFETGNLKPIKAITGPSCALCSKIFPGIEKWNKDGKWIEGADIQVLAVQSTFVRTGAGEFQVAMQSQQSAGTLRQADGTVGQTVSESPMLGDLMIAKYADGRWKANNVDRLG